MTLWRTTSDHVATRDVTTSDLGAARDVTKDWPWCRTSRDKTERGATCDQTKTDRGAARDVIKITRSTLRQSKRGYSPFIKSTVV